MQAVTKAMVLLKRTRHATIGPTNDVKNRDKPTLTEADRDLMQARVLGLLNVLALDKKSRPQIVEYSPKMDDIFHLCENLDGYDATWTATRRKQAARLIASVIIRDAQVRLGCINQVLHAKRGLWRCFIQRKACVLPVIGWHCGIHIPQPSCDWLTALPPLV
jgi:hypothetical protein